MERNLLWIALAVGGVGWLCSLLLTSGGRGSEAVEKPLPRTFLFFFFLLPFLGLAMTLPNSAPFAPGGAFGKGFLLGGLFALLAGWIVNRATHGDKQNVAALHGIAAAVAPCAAALAAITAPLLFMRQSLFDTLLGVAIGWFCETLVLLVGLNRDEKTTLDPATLPLVAGIGFVTTLCGVAVLGEARNAITLSTTVSVHWSAVGMVLAADVPFVLLLSVLLTFVGKRPAQKAGQTAVSPLKAFPGLSLLHLLMVPVGSLLLTGLAKCLFARLNLPLMWQIVAIGSAMGLLAWWVTAARVRAEEQNVGLLAGRGWQNGALGALVLMAGAMIAFQRGQGMGVGLLLIAAWLPAMFWLSLSPTLVSNNEEGTHRSAHKIAAYLIELLLLGTMLLLFRVFTTRFDTDLRGLTLTDQYGLLGLFVGALTPVLLAGFLVRPTQSDPEQPGTNLFRLFVTGVFTLAIPALVLYLYGEKCAQALMMGAGLSIVLNSRREDAPLFATFCPLLAIAVGLALSQWTAHLLPHTLLTRAEKIRALSIGTGGVIVLLLLAEYGGRFRSFTGGRKSGSPSSLSMGGVAK